MSGVKISFLGTGAGGSVQRAHTAIVVDSPDGTRVLLDASSGNSAFRNAGSLGMAPGDFRHLLLSHDHADHMSGLPHIQLVHTRADPQGPPLEVHTSPDALKNVKLLCQSTSPGCPSTRTAPPTTEAARFTGGIPRAQIRPLTWDLPPRPPAFRWTTSPAPWDGGWTVTAWLWCSRETLCSVPVWWRRPGEQGF